MALYERSQADEPWKGIYQCHSGCFYSMCCSACAMCEVAEFLDEPADVGRNIDKFGCVGQTLSICVTLACPISICLCRSWMLPCYYSDYAQRLGTKLGKDMFTLGPCPESSCCDANVRFPPLFACMRNQTPFRMATCLGPVL